MSARKSLFFMIIGLFAFFAYIYFFVGFGELFTVLQTVNSTEYVFYYSLAITVVVLSFFFTALAWRELMNSLSLRIKLKNIFLYTWIGNFVDLAVPCQAVCGEVTKIYLVHKDNRDNYGNIAASSLTNRIIAYFMSSVGLLTGIALVLTRISEVPPLILQLLVVALVGTIIYIAVLFYLALDERAAGKMADILFKVVSTLRLNRFLPADLQEKVQSSLLVFHQGFRTFRDKPRYLAKPILYQLVSLLLNLSAYVLVFYSLGLRDLYVDFFIIVYFIVGTVQISAAVFSVGALDIALANVFVFYGVPDIGFGALAATLLRFLTFWMPLVVGYLIIQGLGAGRLLNPKARETIEMQETIERQPSSV